MGVWSESPTPDEPKPEDIVGYAFAPVCDLDHVYGYGEEKLTIKQATETIVACRQCGRPARYATIRRFAEARWKMLTHFGSGADDPPKYYWSQNGGSFEVRWTRTERVRSLTL